MKANGVKQIAAAAGVSVSTVSRSLRGNPRISERVRAQVNEIAESLGYLPQRGREHTIALAVSRIGGQGYYGDLLDAIQQVAQRRNCRLELILPSETDNFFNRCYYGVICVSLSAKDLKNFAELTKRPVVAFNQEFKHFSNAYSVVSDDCEVMHRIFNEFNSKGRRRTAMLLAGDVASNFNNVLRVAGYRHECRSRKLECIEEIIQEDADAVEASIMRLRKKKIDSLIYLASPLLLNVERFLLQHKLGKLSLVSWEFFVSTRANHMTARQNAPLLAEAAFSTIEKVVGGEQCDKIIHVPYLLG